MSGTQAASLNKFRGALVGALVGDCMGVPYQFETTVSKIVLQKYFDKMEDPKFKTPLKKYTDDTAMTKSIAESLIQNATVDEVDLAKRFVKEFFAEPFRDYGIHVKNVFHKLRNTQFSDIWTPAREQFDGAGSLGNGGAMRIAPIPLFFNSDYQMMLEAAKKCTKITHTHRLGVNGALLQAVAIYQSFCLPPDEDLDVMKFITDLITKIESIEAADKDEIGFNNPQTYSGALKKIQRLLEKGDPPDEEVLEALGNGVEAFYSVPTAIYCFLRAQKPIKNIETENKFRRAVQYSISLGGDTDTIGSMAGAVAGAYHGHDYINMELQRHCEGLDLTLSLADRLHNKALSQKAN